MFTNNQQAFVQVVSELGEVGERSGGGGVRLKKVIHIKIKRG